jgi:hypothetical protein
MAGHPVALRVNGKAGTVMPFPNGVQINGKL